MQSSNIPKRELKLSNDEFIPEIIKLLNEGKTITIRLQGFSMRPFLENNRDKALLAKAKHIKSGDVVLAETTPKHYVLHRIIKIEGENVTLMGDGNLNKEHCTKDDIKGVALGFYRKGRRELETTNSLKWRIYSLTWNFLRPIRRYLLAMYRRMPRK